MDQLLDKLRELLTLAQEKLVELNSREAVLQQGEKDLVDATEALVKKQQEFADREAAVIGVEYSLEVLRKNEATLKENQDINAQLKEEKQKFEVWKSGEEQRIGAQLRAIEREWKELRGEA